MFSSMPVEFEKANVPQHRSMKDTTLTVDPLLHSVNPKDPLHTYTIPPDDYSRHRNILSSNSPFLFGREEVLGKRVRTYTKDMGVVMSYNDTTHMTGTAVNEPLHEFVQPNVLRAYENIVQLHDLINEPAPMTDDTPQYTTGQLIAKSDESAKTYASKANDPTGKF